MVLDVEKPDGASPWLIKLGALVIRPFGVMLDLADRHPWKSVQRYLSNTSQTDVYFGFAFRVVGEALEDTTQTNKTEVS